MAEPRLGHESSAIAARRVIGAGALLAVTVVGVVLLIRIIVGEWITPQHAQVVARRAAIPPEPRLQAHPGNDFAALREQKQALLSTWSWTDSTHEFAHISIERAMVLYQRQHASPSANEHAGVVKAPKDAAR